MIRAFPIAAASAAAFFLAFPADAQTRGYYSATPEASAAKSSFVTRTTVWKCAAGACTAPKSGARDAVMCELAAGEVGKLSAFSANGAAFDAAALEKCNARAK